MEYGSKGKRVEEMGGVLFSTYFKENAKENRTEKIKSLQIKKIIQE
jgi:hypothetical protein